MGVCGGCWGGGRSALARLPRCELITNLEDLKTCKGHISVIWNARSLLPKIEEVERIVTQAEPSFIGITESWLNTSINSSLVMIDGYNIHRSDRTEDSGKKKVAEA